MAELQPPEGPINGGTLVPPLTENVGTKRQRRPSVRLGDIGDQHFDLHLNRRPKQWKVPVKDSGKSSKTRPLVNLSGSADFHETLDGEDKEANLESPAIGSWRVRDSKSKRGLTTKRLRSSWVSKVDEGVEMDGKFSVSGGEDVDDGFRDFDPEGSESPLKEQTPIHSVDNMATDTDRVHENEREVHYHGHMRGFRARVSEGREDLEGPSDTDVRNWHRSERNGVRAWLNQLGLGRYAPVFEIHEVDDEVLPMLTLEDLKDMGINAVGSRRKMYCSIQKLGKGFS